MIQGRLKRLRVACVLPAFAAMVVVVSLLSTKLALAQRIADLPQAAGRGGGAGTTRAAAPQPTLVLSASVASLDAVGAVAKDIGVGEIPVLSAGDIEQRMPFIGAGGLAGDRPLGVLLYAGPGLNLEQGFTFVLPVKPGAAQLKSFTDKGAEPLPGHPDVVALEGATFRRTADQFMFGQSTAIVAAVREDELTSTYKTTKTAPLAQIDFDVAAFKKAMPAQYEAFFEQINNSANAKDADEQVGVDLVVRPMRELKRVRLSAERRPEGALRLNLRLQPVALPKDLPAAAPKFRRPGFPAGAFARADLAYPPAKALSAVTDALSAAMEGDKDVVKTSPEEKQRMRAVLSDVIGLLLDGDTGSLGVGSVNGQTVTYWVIGRRVPPADLGRQIKDLVERESKLPRAWQGENGPSRYESYAAKTAGMTVSRVILVDRNHVPFYVDAISNGQSVFMSFSPSNGKFVERLLSQPPAGDASTLLSGSVDLGELANSNLIPRPQENAGDLKAALKGQHVDWTAAAADDDALRVDIDLPKTLLQALPQLAKIFN